MHSTYSFYTSAFLVCTLLSAQTLTGGLFEGSTLVPVQSANHKADTTQPVLVQVRNLAFPDRAISPEEMRKLANGWSTVRAIIEGSADFMDDEGVLDSVMYFCERIQNHRQARFGRASNLVFSLKTHWNGLFEQSLVKEQHVERTTALIMLGYLEVNVVQFLTSMVQDIGAEALEDDEIDLTN